MMASSAESSAAAIPGATAATIHKTLAAGTDILVIVSLLQDKAFSQIDGAMNASY
jgi:hypothetical protein